MLKLIFKSFTSNKPGKLYLISLFILIFSNIIINIENNLFIVTIIASIVHIIAVIYYSRYLKIKIWIIILLVVLPFIPMGSWMVFFYFVSQNYNIKKTKNNSEKIPGISINEVLKVFTKNFSDIKSSDDIFNQLPKEKFIDITHSNEIEELNAMNDKRINNKFYKFDEINSEVGELDIDFFNKELANIRIQLFNNDYTPEKIKQFINNLINTNWNNNSKLPRIFLEKYKYVGIFNDRLVIGIREIKNSISIAITHIKYF